MKYGFVRGKYATGVYYNIKPDGDSQINIIKLKKKREKLELILQKKISGELSGIKEFIGKNEAVVLCIDGKGIIHRKGIKNTNNSLLNNIIPNANEEDFTLQELEISHEEVIFSIARNDLINSLIYELRSENIFVTNLYLGFFPLVKDQSTIDINMEKTIIGDWELIYESKKLKSINKVENNSNSDIPLNDEVNLNSNSLIAYLAGRSFFSFDFFKENTNRQFFSNKDFLYNRLGNWLLWSSLAFSLLVLSANFFVYSQYFHKNQLLVLDISQNQYTLTKLEASQIKLQQRQALIQNSNSLGSNKFSYYADRIASMVPENILLVDMDIHPEIHKLRNQEIREYELNTIKLKGEANTGYHLNEFILALKDLKWIKEIQLENYSQEDFKTPGGFIIRISIK